MKKLLCWIMAFLAATSFAVGVVYLITMWVW